MIVVAMHMLKDMLLTFPSIFLVDVLFNTISRAHLQLTHLFFITQLSQIISQYHIELGSEALYIVYFSTLSSHRGTPSVIVYPIAHKHPLYLCMCTIHCAPKSTLGCLLNSPSNTLFLTRAPFPL